MLNFTLKHSGKGKYSLCKPLLSQNKATTSSRRAANKWSIGFLASSRVIAASRFNHIKPCWRLKDIICLHAPRCLLTRCLCHLGCKSGGSLVFKPDCFQYEWHILWWHNCYRVCRNCLKAKSSVQRKEKWQGYSYVKWMCKRHQLRVCKAQELKMCTFCTVPAK